MPLAHKTYQTILDELKSRLLTTTSLRQLSKGGTARSILEVIAAEHADIYSDIVSNVSQGFLKYASGEYLDAYGEMFGVYRKGTTYAFTTSDEANLKFYVDSDTFEDINDGSSFTVPAGTKISTVSGLEYILNSSVTLGSETEKYVSAIASTAGSYSNVDKDTLINHDFTSYDDYENESLKVINDYAIGNGQDVETDTNYRYRISKKLLELEKANLAALYVNLLSLPGIKDINIDRYESGLGTATLYVYGIYPNQSDQMAVLGQVIANSVSAVGDRILVKSPDIVGISFRAKINFKTTRTSSLTQRKELTTTEKKAIAEKAEEAVINYFENMSIFEPFSTEKLMATIINADEKILDIGENDTSFDYVLIWRELPDGTDYSKYLIGNYTPETGEYITLKAVDFYYD